MLSTSIRWRLRSMSEGRQNSCSNNRLTAYQTKKGANLMERQCRCRYRIKSVIVQLLWVGAQLPTLYNTVLPKFKGTKYEEVLKRVNLHARIRVDLVRLDLTRHLPKRTDTSVSLKPDRTTASRQQADGDVHSTCGLDIARPQDRNYQSSM